YPAGPGAGTYDKPMGWTGLLTGIARQTSQQLDPLPAPVKTRYCKLQLGASFVDALRTVLYAKPVQTSDTGHEIVRMDRLHSICTFNFEDSIEPADADGRFASVFDDPGRRDRTRIPIYHVHGFLPQDPSKSASQEVVFSEDDYHRVYAEPYHWSNLIQANLLSNCVCLFVGLSFSDPNLRRIIDVTSKARASDSLVALCMAPEVRLHPIDTTQRYFAKATWEFYETIYADIGVSCLFVDSYAEIPIILRAIGSADPASVYVHQAP